MGLESLSRGAKHAKFFEADRSAVTRLRKNIAALKVEDRAKVIAQDLFQWFGSAVGAGDVELIFLDPPYRYVRERPDDLKDLAQKFDQHLSPGGIVIFRHDAADALELPLLKAFDRRDYGQMTIELLSRLSNAR